MSCSNLFGEDIESKKKSHHQMWKEKQELISGPKLHTMFAEQNTIMYILSMGSVHKQSRAVTDSNWWHC